MSKLCCSVQEKVSQGFDKWTLKIPFLWVEYLSALNIRGKCVKCEIYVILLQTKNSTGNKPKYFKWIFFLFKQIGKNRFASFSSTEQLFTIFFLYFCLNIFCKTANGNLPVAIQWFSSSIRLYQKWSYQKKEKKSFMRKWDRTSSLVLWLVCLCLFPGFKNWVTKL